MNGNNILKTDGLTFDTQFKVEQIMNTIENICIDNVIENAKQDVVSNVYITMLKGIRDSTKNEKIKMIIMKTIDDVEDNLNGKDVKVDEAVPATPLTSNSKNLISSNPLYVAALSIAAIILSIISFAASLIIHLSSLL